MIKSRRSAVPTDSTLKSTSRFIACPKKNHVLRYEILGHCLRVCKSKCKDFHEAFEKEVEDGE